MDIVREHIALAEAIRLNIPIFAMVDTNSDPRKVDFPIPSNDDASKSIEMMMGIISKAVKEGNDLRSKEKEVNQPKKDKKQEEKTSS